MYWRVGLSRATRLVRGDPEDRLWIKSEVTVQLATNLAILVFSVNVNLAAAKNEARGRRRREWPRGPDRVASL